MKQNQIQIYSFDRNDISDGVISSDDLENNLISLSESFLTHAYECYTGKTLADGQVIEEIIKVLLSNDEEKAKEEWNNGITFNDKKYFAWFATTGGMKIETNRGKCETIFLREDFIAFAKDFENLISLGKFQEIEDSGEKICINKDILSRLSLGISNSHMAGDLPNFIVLRQPVFHITKDYKTVKKEPKKEIDKDGNEKDTVEYDLVDFHFDKDIEVFDGGGIATPAVFEQIKKELNLNYDVEFAIIRGYGIAIKGMITLFDILKYMDAAYKSDTPYFKKVVDKFYLLDYWNEWQEVTENTMLLNESMVKLAKYYKSDNGENLSSYKDRLSNADEKYKDIIGKLYVTKVNKNPSDVHEYRKLNYQLLTALALSKQDYYDLIKEDVHVYRKILKPFEKNSGSDAWITNLDIIRLFFKNVVDGNLQTEEEIERDAKKLSENIANKCEELLDISEEFIKLKYVKQKLAYLIEKKCRELACGKVTAKATYRYIAVCPISYLNYAMTREQGANGLQTGQFYSSDCNDGAVRTIARNPLCAYSEVHNVKFVKNIFFDNYLSDCKELIYFNQQSDILALMSSGDCDGDACTVIDNDIIRNAVVVPKDGKYFLNADDGHKETMVYNLENKFLATYRASGNLIGKIALKSASVNSDSQLSLPYFDTINLIYVSIDDIEAENIEEQKKVLKQKIDSGEWVKTIGISEQHKEFIRNRFYENEKDIYTVLYNAMVSIDAPKTLYFPSSEDMDSINKKYERKAYFLSYKEKPGNFAYNQYEWTYGLLNVTSKFIKTKLLDLIKDISTDFGSNHELIQHKLINGDYNIDMYEDCFAEMQSIYKHYSSERSAIADKRRNSIKSDTKTRYELINDEQWNEWDEEDYYLKIAGYKEDARRLYKELDAKYILEADKMFLKYDNATIANAIGNLKNCTEDFIINLFFPVFDYVDKRIKSDRYVYKQCADGEIEYLYEKYTKIVRPASDDSAIIKNLHLEEERRLKAISVMGDIRVRILDKSSIELIQTEIDKNGHIAFEIMAEEDKVYLYYAGEKLLEVFRESFNIEKYSLLNAKNIECSNLLNIASSRKSCKLTVTNIVI